MSILHPDPYDNMKMPYWKLVLTAVDGGFIQTEDIRLDIGMREAPTSGYQASVEIEKGPDSAQYLRQFNGCFFLTSRNGQHFAKVRFDMTTFWDERGVPFGIQSYGNTNASRVLEIDQGKLINLNQINGWR